MGIKNLVVLSGDNQGTVDVVSRELGLTKATSSNMKQNITIAVGVVLILLTGLLFSEWANMSAGMLVHELSILVVILNGMRLLGYRPRQSYKK